MLCKKKNASPPEFYQRPLESGFGKTAKQAFNNASAN
jgi:hypothetical protein